MWWRHISLSFYTQRGLREINDDKKKKKNYKWIKWKKGEEVFDKSWKLCHTRTPWAPLKLYRFIKNCIYI